MKSEWRHGYGQKYNHLVSHTTGGFAGTTVYHFACGKKSDFVRDEYENTYYSRCPKCAKNTEQQLQPDSGQARRRLSKC